MKNYGELTAEQLREVLPHIDGRIIHDLGAGNLALAKLLLEAGALEVVAIDSYGPPAKIPEYVTFIHLEFELYAKATKGSLRTALLSWPSNWFAAGLGELLDRSRTVIYLGKNTEGTVCGTSGLFRRHLVQRQILVHVPDRRNTLIVYGAMGSPRPLVLEEQAACDRSKIYPFDGTERHTP